MSLHGDEIEIDLPLVRALVDRALPDLAGHPLRRLETSGSSNCSTGSVTTSSSDYHGSPEGLRRSRRRPGGCRTSLRRYLSMSPPL